MAYSELKCSLLIKPDLQLAHYFASINFKWLNFYSRDLTSLSWKKNPRSFLCPTFSCAWEELFGSPKKKIIQMCIKSYIIFEKVLTFSQQTFILLCYSVGKSLFNKGTYFELVKRKPTTNCIEIGWVSYKNIFKYKYANSFQKQHLVSKNNSFGKLPTSDFSNHLFLSELKSLHVQRFRQRKLS